MNAKRLTTLSLPLLMATATAASAADPSTAVALPAAMFVQVGVASHANAVTAGAWWDWAWRSERDLGLVTGYLEVALGHWSSRAAGGAPPSPDVTQFGITPVLRLQPRRWRDGWFVEGGIGLNVVTPTYRSGGKRFSTRFNFGDHVAVGLRFGPRRAHELALRLQHFSNGGIEHPNPGENFVQLRYLRRY